MGSEVEVKLSEHMGRYRRLEEEKQEVVSQLNQLNTQLVESDTVKYELDHVRDGRRVYRSVGPLFIKQTLGEAKNNVNQRLKFINDEVNRKKEKIGKIEKDQDQERKLIISLQQRL